MRLWRNEWGDVRAVWWILLWIITVAIAGGGSFVGVYHLDKESCHRKAAAMGREWRFGILEGCLVQHNGRFVPIDTIRFTDEEEA